MRLLTYAGRECVNELKGIASRNVNVYSCFDDKLDKFPCAVGHSFSIALFLHLVPVTGRDYRILMS
jgi:hypothetical protein